VFELSDQVVEQIIFAMEDQERATVVDLETGEVLPAGEGTGSDRVPPPIWSSREGYRVMEVFISTLRIPTARRELAAALSRGRGVFKSFKAALAEHPDLERAFRDYKARVMRRSIAVWYDDLLEARGLERLGPEPPETEDLLATDLEIRVVAYDEARELLEPLIEEAEAAAVEYLPASLVVFEIEGLRAEFEEENDALCALADDGEGGLLGAAVSFRVISAEGSFGRVVFLFVRDGFRRMGLGSSLLSALSKRYVTEGIRLLVLDSGLVPGEFAEGLSTHGYKAYGVRTVIRLE
jgi:GNAT superfamily N-acetyltransferase